MPTELATLAIRYPEAELALSELERRFCFQRAGLIDPVEEPLRAQARHTRVLPEQPFIVLNGSGSHHHETVVLLEQFLEQRQVPKVTYVQIDAHPDKEPGYRWLLGCASFVGRILEHPKVEAAYLLGINPPASLQPDASFPYIDKLNYYRCDYFEKLRLYSLGGTSFAEVIFEPEAHALSSARANPAVRRVRRGKKQRPADPAPRTAATVEWRTVDELDPASLPKNPIYLTIDLDVLRDWPITDWRKGGSDAPLGPHGLTENQGDMELETLLSLIARLGAARTIVAADLCGLTSGVEKLARTAQEGSLAVVGEVYRALRAAMGGGG